MFEKCFEASIVVRCRVLETRRERASFRRPTLRLRYKFQLQLLDISVCIAFLGSHQGARRKDRNHWRLRWPRSSSQCIVLIGTEQGPQLSRAVHRSVAMHVKLFNVIRGLSRVSEPGLKSISCISLLHMGAMIKECSPLPPSVRGFEVAKEAELGAIAFYALFSILQLV